MEQPQRTYAKPSPYISGLCFPKLSRALFTATRKLMQLLPADAYIPTVSKLLRE